MENTLQDIEQLRNGFQACQKILTALGDENRQRLLCIMLGGDCGGSRVVDIAEKTNLSRPAVSHHMQILKDAGIVKVRKEGTYVYYYLDPDETEIEKMIALFSNIRRIMRNVPDRSGQHTRSCRACKNFSGGKKHGCYESNEGAPFRPFL